MKTAVVDASFSASWFLKDEHSPHAEEILERFLKGSLVLWVPSLWFYEITNLLVTACNRFRIHPSAVEESFDLMDALPLKTDTPDIVAARRSLRLAQHSDLSAYDAAYLELANRLQIPLLTFDKKLVRACQSHHLETKV